MKGYCCDQFDIMCADVVVEEDKLLVNLLSTPLCLCFLSLFTTLDLDWLVGIRLPHFLSASCPFVSSVSHYFRVLSFFWFRSQFDSLDLVVDFMVERVEVTDECFFDKGTRGWLVARISLLQAMVEDIPLLIELVPLLRVLLHTELLAHLRLHLHSLFERIWVNLLQDRLQCDQRLLQDLVPVVLSQINDYRHQHRECLVLVSLQDVQEVIVLKEAHGSVCNLQMISSYAFDNAFK